MNQYLAKFESELARAEKRCEDLRTTIRMIKEVPPETEADTAAPYKQVERPIQKSQDLIGLAPRSGSLRAVIRREAMNMLSSRSALTSAELVAELGQRGIEVTGDTQDRKIATVSGALSNDKENFVSDRKIGWSLAKKNPESVAAQSGFVQGASPDHQ